MANEHQINFHKARIKTLVDSIRQNWTPCKKTGCRDDKRAFELLELLADYSEVYRFCHEVELGEEKDTDIYDMIGEVGMYISGRWEGKIIDIPDWME